MSAFGPASEPGRGSVLEWDLARGGVAVAHVDAGPLGGHVAEGVDTVDAPGGLWSVHYRLETDADGQARRLVVRSVSAAGVRARELDHDGRGAWRVDGGAARGLEGCRDVDLASGVLSATATVRRLELEPGDERTAAVVWVGAPDLEVDRVERVWRRLPDDGDTAVYGVRSALATAERRLTLDPDGYVLDVADVAVRRRSR